MPYSYLFRGTTIEYPGNVNAIKVPYACTSTHPVKALWFALECVSKNPDSAVVYLANAEKLSGIEIMKNCLEAKEDEVALGIKPSDFYPLCEGYIHIVDFQKILQGFDINVYKAVRKENLTYLCEETLQLNETQINLIVEEMRKYLKK